MARELQQQQQGNNLILDAEVLSFFAEASGTPDWLVQQIRDLEGNLRQFVGNMAYQLPASVKLERPKAFSGQMDAEVVDAFVFQLEQYFALTGLADDNAQARFASMLFVDSAAVWLRSQSLDFDLLIWSDLKTKVQEYFRPKDYKRRARDGLRQCQQRAHVSGYITAFRKAASRVEGITDDELFDRFVAGLKPRVREQVLLSQADSFEEACIAAERVGIIFMEAGLPRHNFQRTGGSDGTYTGKGYGHTPMEGINSGMQGVGNSLGRRDQPKFTGKCRYCQRVGHKERDCWQKDPSKRPQRDKARFSRVPPPPQPPRPQAAMMELDQQHSEN